MISGLAMSPSMIPRPSSGTRLLLVLLSIYSVLLLFGHEISRTSFLKVGTSSVAIIWHLALSPYLWASPIPVAGYVLMKNQGTTVEWQRLSGQRMGFRSGSGAANVVNRLFWTFELHYVPHRRLYCTRTWLHSLTLLYITRGVRRRFNIKEATNESSTSWYMEAEQEWMYVFILLLDSESTTLADILIERSFRACICKANV